MSYEIQITKSVPGSPWIRVTNWEIVHVSPWAYTVPEMPVPSAWSFGPERESLAAWFEVEFESDPVECGSEPEPTWWVRPAGMRFNWPLPESDYELDLAF